jgi:hypothetical protein
VFGLLANIASILGLIASLAAWRAASNARDAARQARQEVRLGNAAEKLNNLSTRATELLALVERDEPIAATLRGRDLTSELVHTRLRWERFLSAESKVALSTAVAQVQEISLKIATKGIPETPQGKQRLLTFCHSVNQVLNAESAKMLAEIESQGEMHGRAS